MRRILYLPVSLFLFTMACTTADKAPDPEPKIIPAATVNVAPRRQIQDRDPVDDWQGRAPDRHPVHGIDAARFQGEIDWATARKAGVNFAYIKATEGGDLLDPMFKDHWKGAKRAGVVRGAYHFYYFCTSAADQARWFIRNVSRRAGAMPPVLDMEWNPFSPTCKLRPPGDVVRSEMLVFLNKLERHYGQRPVIYTTPRFYRENELSKMGREEFWLRSTAKTPSAAFPGQRWTFWQYSGTGIIPGIVGDIDLNTFNGSGEAWTNWLAARQQ